MENEEKMVLEFEIGQKQLKFKDLMKKQFIEMDVYAISDADPNRNGFHFTLDSMKKVVESGSLKNKPIVGFFEKGDFTTHEGVAGYDIELGETYWDTTNGERILGWIRESDPVEIVELNGLHWIKFRCILCVTYCYNQVKRLLKDKKKKVSVEVTVHEKVDREDGVVDIVDFDLNGTTILGSKNGKQIMEGIAGAHATVLSGLDEDALEKQREALSFAYNFANKDNEDDSSEKYLGKEELNTQMEDDVKKISEGEEGTDPNTENTGSAEATAEEGQQECHNEEHTCDGNDDCGNQDGDEGTGEDGTEPKAKDDEDPEDEFGHYDNNGEEGGEGPNGEGEGEEHPEEPKEDEKLCQMAEKVKELEAMCSDYRAQIESINEQFSKEKELLMTEFEQREKELKEKIETFSDYEDVKSCLAETKEKLSTAEAKLFEHFCNDLTNFAKNLMNGEIIAKADYDSIIEKCSTGKYASEEDVKRDIAFAVFSSRPQKRESFSVSITTPNNVVPTPSKKSVTNKDIIDQIWENGHK